MKKNVLRTKELFFILSLIILFLSGTAFGQNTAPTVDAGSDQCIAGTGTVATLDATVSDDGLPASPGSVTTTWSKVSGPGNVTFGDSSSIDTTASFSVYGTYVLRLTADDGDLQTIDDVTIGFSQRYTLPAKIEFEDYQHGAEGTAYHDFNTANKGGEYRNEGVDIYTCNDVGGGYYVGQTYGNPYNEWLTYAINVPATKNYDFTLRLATQYDSRQLYLELDGVNITGTVTFNNTGGADSWVDLEINNINLSAGNHELKLYLIGWYINLNYMDIDESVQPPVVNAGSDASITMPTYNVSLDATVSGATSTRWQLLRGPASGTVSFADATAVDTTATFDYPGEYVLRLTADNGIGVEESDEVTITVNDYIDRVMIPAKIEAEDFMLNGGEGIAYHDFNTTNKGGEYRLDEAVDIYTCTDTGGGYYVGQAYGNPYNEWLVFPIEVPETRAYDITLRIATQYDSRKIHLEIDNENVTGTVSFDNTGGATSWADLVIEGVHLTAGKHLLKYYNEQWYINLNYIDIQYESCESYIVQNNAANADIVISTNPERTVSIAADELQSYIYKMTGATLPIVSTPSSANLHIYVGQSSYTDNLGITNTGLDNGAFKIVSGTDWLVLIGKDDNYVPQEPYAHGSGDRSRAEADWDALTPTTPTDVTWEHPYDSVYRRYNSSLDIWEYDGRGSLNAVCEFLRNLGVRWYFPGTTGEVVPSLDDIGLPKTNRTITPDFAVRDMYQYYMNFSSASDEEVLWQLHLGLNRGLDIRGTVTAHGSSYIHSRDEVKIANPTYYAIYNGVRATDFAGGIGAPCLSSTGLFNENVDFIELLYNTFDEPMVNVSPVDGYINCCECTLCSGLATPERGYNGQISDYVWKYANDIATALNSTYPNKKVGCFAYGAYLFPPEDITTMSPNLSVTICRWRSQFVDPDKKAFYDSIRNDWLNKVSGNILIWDYYLHSRPEKDYAGIPVYFTSVIAENLRELKGDSDGEFIEVHRNYPPDQLAWHALASNHLNVYLTARLWWQAGLDANALLDEYYTKFYGPAASEMKVFVEYCEANWNDAPDNSAVVTQMRSYLSAAQTAAGSSGIYRDRVDLIDEFLKLAE